MSTQEKTDRQQQLRKQIQELTQQIEDASPSKSARLSVELEKVVDEFVREREKD